MSKLLDFTKTLQFDIVSKYLVAEKIRFCSRKRLRGNEAPRMVSFEMMVKISIKIERFCFDTFLKDLFHFRIQQQQWRQDVDSRRGRWLAFGKERVLFCLSSGF